MSNLKKLIKDHWIKPFIIIGLFLACLSISILIKKWFDVDGDYLSAFATLVAAVVAAYLFSDWRDEQAYQNDKEQYEKLCIAESNYIATLDYYVKTLWKTRFNSEEHFLDHIKTYEAFEIANKKFKYEIAFTKQTFTKVSFKIIDDKINCIDHAIKQILPLDLEKIDDGYIDKKYVDEDLKLRSLLYSFDDLFFQNIQLNIQEALKEKISK